MNVQMLEWALAVTAGSKGDLLELYCGNGNFSLALARNFERVLATEIAKPSVAAAQYNIAANHIDNVQIIRMAAEDFTQRAMNGVREFNRLKGIDLSGYNCETIFVDPRSGLDDETVKMVQAYPRILYISCNPETLCANTETLQATHRVSRLGAVRSVPVYPSHGMRRAAGKALLIRGAIMAPVALRLLSRRIRRLARLQFHPDPQHQRHADHRRQEVGTDLRVFGAHDGAVHQQPQQETGRRQFRHAVRHGAVQVTLMQAVHRQHQRDQREDRKRHHRAEQRGKGTVDRKAGNQRQQ